MKKIYINPDKITKTNNLGYGPFDNTTINTFETEVFSGDWDCHTLDFEDNIVYDSLKKLFLQNVDWSETKLYSFISNNLNTGNILWNCDSEDVIKNRENYLRKLYDHINETKNIPNGHFEEDDILVSINRNGEFLFAKNGTHRLSIAKILGLKRIPVRIYRVHEDWTNYKLDVENLCQKLWNGRTYQNLPHPDFSEIETMWPDERFEILHNNTEYKNGSLVDIGSLFGNICYQAELEGYTCTAIETDEVYLRVMKKLHSSYNMSYQIVEKSFLDVETNFDIVVAFNIFHHFLKTESLYNSFKRYLNKIKFNEMFIQVHHTSENQMNDAFINLSPEEFVNFVASETNKNNIKYLSEFRERKIYKIF